jgi:hypothetical protein
MKTKMKMRPMATAMAAETATEMEDRVPAEAEVRGAARCPGGVEDMEPAAFAIFMGAAAAIAIGFALVAALLDPLGDWPAGRPPIPHDRHDRCDTHHHASDR